VGRQVIERFKDRSPSAVKCMAEDLEGCLQCLRLPAEHHQRVRTTNLLERLFGKNRRRVKIVPHFFAERAGMKLVHATMLAASRRRHGVQMSPLVNRPIDQLWQDLFGKTTEELWAAQPMSQGRAS